MHKYMAADFHFDKVLQNQNDFSTAFAKSLEFKYNRFRTDIC